MRVQTAKALLNASPEFKGAKVKGVLPEALGSTILDQALSLTSDEALKKEIEALRL